MKTSPYAIVDTADPIDLERPLVRRSRILQSVLVVGLCFSLSFAVLAFGAVQEWSTFVFEVGAVVLFLVWAGKQVVSGQVKLSKNPLYAPALFFFVLLLAQVGLGISAYGYVTKYGVLQYVSYGIVLLIAAECVQEEDARKRFALALIIFGASYAFFALAQELTSDGKFFWFYTPRFHGSIYGTYVNHNHYAGLMEMLVPFPLVVSMGHLLTGEASLGCVLYHIDGQHDLPFRLAWRNAVFRSRNCRVCRPDSHTEKKPSCRIGSVRSVRPGSRFLVFYRQRAGSGATRGPGPWHTVQYHQGLHKNVFPPASVGVGPGNFPNCLSQLPQLLHESVRK